MPAAENKRPSRSFYQYFFTSISRGNASGANRALPDGTGSTQTQPGLFNPNALDRITEQDKDRFERDEQFDEHLDALFMHFGIFLDSSDNQSNDGEVEVRSGRAGPRCVIS
jgi:hypothetical protein